MFTIIFETTDKKCTPYSSVKLDFKRKESQEFNKFFNCESKQITIQCNKQNCITINYLNDLIPDCPTYNHDIPPDEEIYYNLLFNGIKGNPCENNSLLQCYKGHPKCFAVSDLCYFDHDHNGNLKVCRNGAHLRNCSFYACSDSFKCPNAYCIPYWKVCDGTWDCTYGEEESLCNDRSCSGLLKCKYSSLCIHFNNLCDGINHCPEMDDEMACNVAECPQGCSCLIQAVWCDGLDKVYSATLFKYNTTIVALTIVHSVIHVDSIILGQYAFHSLSILNLSYNNIEDSCVKVTNEKQELKKLVTFDLSCNKIRVIKSCLELIFKNIRMFHLQFNSVHVINDIKLKYLKYLDISNNFLTSLTNKPFKGLLSLEVINIVQNPLLHIESQIFASVTKLMLKTDCEKLQCIASNHKSIVLIDSSKVLPKCDNLISNENIFSVLIPILFISWILNVGSLINNMTLGARRKTYDILVAIVNFSDILMIVYIAIISCIIKVYKGRYIAIQDEWKIHPICLFISSINLYSIILMCALMSLLAYARFSIVKYPLLSKFKEKNFTKKIVMLTCIFVAAIVLAYQILYTTFSGNYSSNTFCLLVPYPDEENLALEYGLFSRFILHICSLTFISVMAAATILELKTSEFQNADRSSSVFYSLLSTTFTNVICWLPLDLVFMFGSHLCPSIMAWLIVGLMPINTLLDPVLLTLFQIDIKGIFFKITGRYFIKCE